MKITKSDLTLTKKEYSLIINKLNIGIFLKYDSKNYQCSNCHTVFLRSDEKCHKCNSVKSTVITKGNKNYDKQNLVQIYRKNKDSVIGLAFLIADTQNKGFSREILLVRKTTYKNKVEVLRNNNLHYDPTNRLFSYYSYYSQKKEGNFDKEKPSNILGFMSDYTINEHILLEHKILGLIYKDVSQLRYADNRNFEIDLEHPYLMEMLHKRSKRSNLYHGIKTIKRYKKAYLKYFDYFEKINSFNPRLLMRLNKVEGKLTYNVFERLNSFDKLPAEIRTKRQLELYSNIATKSHSTYRFDFRSYKDYLEMCKQRSLDISSEDVLFNKKWKQQHDEWMKEIKLEKEMAKNKKLLKVYEKIENKEIDGFYIEKPNGIKGLFEEAEKLHHCISGYADRIIKKESVVLFVRETPGIPFLTAEIIEGKITQLRGSYNKTNMITHAHTKSLQKYIESNLSF